MPVWLPGEKRSLLWTKPRPATISSLFLLVFAQVSYFFYLLPRIQAVSIRDVWINDEIILRRIIVMFIQNRRCSAVGVCWTVCSVSFQSQGELDSSGPFTAHTHVNISKLLCFKRNKTKQRLKYYFICCLLQALEFLIINLEGRGAPTRTGPLAGWGPKKWYIQNNC